MRFDVVVNKNSNEMVPLRTLRMFASISFACVFVSARGCVYWLNCAPMSMWKWKWRRQNQEEEEENGSIEWKFSLSWPRQATHTPARSCTHTHSGKVSDTHTRTHHRHVVRSLHGLIFESQYEENPPYSFRIFLFANINANAHDTEKKTTTRELRKREANEEKWAKNLTKTWNWIVKNGRQLRIVNRFGFRLPTFPD